MKFKLEEKQQFKYYTDGIKTIKVKTGEIPPDGFIPGRTGNFKAWNKGLSAETDERVRKNVTNAHNTRNKIYHPAWNKGLTVDSDERVKNNVENAYKTIQTKYGVNNISQYITKQQGYKPWNKNLTKETNDSLKQMSNNKLGKVPWNKGLTQEIDSRVVSHPQSPETREKIRNTHLNPEFKDKRYTTMKLNGTFTVQSDTSAEKKVYQELLKIYDKSDIVQQYFDKTRYPFKCDFYIISEDLFIEVHGNWTHGGRPYDSNDEECQKQLKMWQEKAKTSNYYKNAIYTWTDLDVRKVNIAKDNNLNFKVIYK